MSYLKHIGSAFIGGCWVHSCPQSFGTKALLLLLLLLFIYVIIAFKLVLIVARENFFAIY